MLTNAYSNLLAEIKGRFSGREMALLMVHIGNLACINRQHGYDNGDLLLSSTIDRVRGVARERDFMCLLGSNRAALLLGGVGSDGQARLAAQKVLREIRCPFELGDASVALDAHIGVALTTGDSYIPSHLVAKAETALSAARSNNSEFEVLSLDGTNDNLPQHALSFDVGHALDRSEFLIFFQPTVDLATGKMVGAEALLRWNSSEQGVVTPDHFLPTVESASDILKITSYVVGASCRALSRWHAAGKCVWVAVNATAHDLQHIDFVPMLRDSIALWNIDPTYLVIEITESVLLTDPVACRKTLEELHALGIKIAIDDFGTGYSSMAYLRDLTADELKIDRSFITNIKSSDKDRKIIQSIVQLAKALNMIVVAEGLEDVVAAKLALRLGCNLGQGYLFGRPAAELPDLPCISAS